MDNRRNYYRLLHVQPDAPSAVIKASYGALMLKLKQHPDLGGDHENATLINEAYATLSDARTRRAYDDYLGSRQAGVGFGPAPFQRHSRSRPSQPPQHRGDQSSTGCLFCHAPCRCDSLAGNRCLHCGSPLCPTLSIRPQGGDQRAVQRFQHGGEVLVRTRHTVKSVRAAIHDLSPTGMGLLAQAPLTIDQVVKIDGTILSAVARVINCRPSETAEPRGQSIGVKFLTLEFTETRGIFVSSQV
jgi:hypothetical protein